MYRPVTKYFLYMARWLMLVNRVLLAIIIVGISGGLLAIAAIPEQSAMAGVNKKYHFTHTMESSLSPAQGHETHQIITVHSPNSGTIYDGSISYTSSTPVQIAILHEIDPDNSMGQPIWRIDENTVYGWTFIDDGKSAGTLDYTGSGLMLHTRGDEFVATFTVDGWIRGQPTDIILQNPVQDIPPPSVLLSRTNVPATIPMHLGFYDGEELMYIITDASDADWADEVTEIQEWRVEVAPPLASTSEDILNTMYVFTNGISGDGLYGYQSEVFQYTPNQDEYNALSRMVELTWKPGQKLGALEFASDIEDAIEAGRITMEYAGVVVNTPQIVWPDGQMMVRENQNIDEDMSYGGGQITDINHEEMTVTFVAHRGWGPDGQTIYYIVTDATPLNPAENMGVINSPTLASLITSPAAVDLFQFANGLTGTGPLGFQPGIAAAAPGDESYSPMWRIYMVEWNNPEDARLLETIQDVDHYRSEGMLTSALARPMNADHIVNCPFIDPFQ